MRWELRPTRPTAALPRRGSRPARRLRGPAAAGLRRGGAGGAARLPSLPPSIPPASGRPGAALLLLSAEPSRPREGLHLPLPPGGGARGAAEAEACPRREEMEAAAAAAGPGGSSSSRGWAGAGRRLRCRRPQPGAGRGGGGCSSSSRGRRWSGPAAPPSEAGPRRGPRLRRAALEGPVRRGGEALGRGRGGGLATGSGSGRSFLRPVRARKAAGAAGGVLSLPAGGEGKPARLPPPEREKFDARSARVPAAGARLVGRGGGVGFASARPHRSEHGRFPAGTPPFSPPLTSLGRWTEPPRKPRCWGKEEPPPLPAAGRPVELDLVSVEQGTGVPGGGVGRVPFPAWGPRSWACPGLRWVTELLQALLLRRWVFSPLTGEPCVRWGRTRLAGGGWESRVGGPAGAAGVEERKPQERSSFQKCPLWCALWRSVAPHRLPKERGIDLSPRFF